MSGPSIRKDSQQKAIVAPHTTCDSCGRNSGPEFILTDLRGPSDYHRSNLELLGSQRSSTVADINLAVSQILQLDKEISNLQKIVECLQVRRGQLEEFRVQESSLLAPIRKVPDEVLQRVFLMVLGMNRISVSGIGNRGDVPTIMKVCAHWRSVASSSPALWSRIGIQWTKKRPSGYELYLERAITNSGDLPLDLTLITKPKLIGDPSVKMLATSAHRWQHVEIEDYGNILKAVIALMPGNMGFSRLESLKIITPTKHTTFRDTPLLTHLILENDNIDISSKLIISSASSLSNLDIVEIHHPYTSFINFPWAQITDLRCIDCRFAKDELADLLRSMTNLTTLTIFGIKETTQNVVLPKLQTLILEEVYIDYTDEEIVPDVLDVLTAPNLKTLEFQELEYSSQSVTQFLIRSSRMLENLTLFKTHIGEGWKTLPLWNLKKLCLKLTRNLTKDLQVLTREENNTDILPRLEKLTLLDVPFADKMAVKYLIPMLRSRLRPSNTSPDNGGIVYLKSPVTIVFERDLNRHEKSEIDEFKYSALVRQSGVRIDVRYGEFPSDNDSDTTDSASYY